VDQSNPSPGLTKAFAEAKDPSGGALGMNLRKSAIETEKEDRRKGEKKKKEKKKKKEEKEEGEGKHGIMYVPKMHGTVCIWLTHLAPQSKAINMDPIIIKFWGPRILSTGH